MNASMVNESMVNKSKEIEALMNESMGNKLGVKESIVKCSCSLHPTPCFLLPLNGELGPYQL